MLNYIWLAFLLIAVVVGGFTGKLPDMTTGAFKTAEMAVMGIALPLVGIMVIWLGIMRLAERSGMVQIIARVLQPVLRRLFPEVPPEHPAMGAMVMNMAANMLGLGNAATPLGLRAMSLLDQLNPRKGIPTNAMVTFLVINTASIQLIPTTAIGILAIAGSKDPTAFVPAAVLATVIGLPCGIAMAKLLERLPMFALTAGGGNPSGCRRRENSGTGNDDGRDSLAGAAYPAPQVDSLRVLFTFIAIFIVIAYPTVADAWPRLIGADWRFADLFPDLAGKPVMRVVKTISVIAVPFLLSFFPLYATLRGVKVYEQFTEGAKEAFGVAQRIIPFLVAMLVSISMLREAGVIQAVTNVLRPLLGAIGFPADLLTMVLLRPSAAAQRRESSSIS
jgi:spore maturation protein SpmA